MILVDEALLASGDFGPAQWLMLFLFCLVNVLSAFHYFAQTFISLGSDVACDNTTDLEDFSSDTSDIQFRTLTAEVRCITDLSEDQNKGPQYLIIRNREIFQQWSLCIGTLHTMLFLSTIFLVRYFFNRKRTFIFPHNL